MNIYIYLKFINVFGLLSDKAEYEAEQQVNGFG